MARDIHAWFDALENTVRISIYDVEIWLRLDDEMEALGAIWRLGQVARWSDFGIL